MTYSEEDIANNTMNLLSATSTWILVRHQWLMTKMRSILTGESCPSLIHLYQFDAITSDHLNLPDNLDHSFNKVKQRLEVVWEQTVKSHHPSSGLSVFDQLNLFQVQAHQFMHESKELNQQLWRDFTMRDPLTGTLTRLTLKSTLLQEMNRSKRHLHDCSIALIDHNKFKDINDEWGHHTGDKVLIVTAQLIQKSLRSEDKLFRYGGDEWLILMPNTNRKEANLMLKRIQKITAEFHHCAGDQIKFKSTFNFGISECAQYDNVHDWIEAADQNLYKAKKRLLATHDSNTATNLNALEN
ncbi:MAG: GGDEF domain-containing protein [Pseudomonadota bacterium]